MAIKKNVKEGTEAENTLHPGSKSENDPKSRLEVMNAVVSGLNQLPSGTFYDNAAKVTAMVDSLRAGMPDKAGELRATISVKEDVEAMFAESDLTEEGKAKAAILFEAAVGAKVQLEIARIQEEYDARFDEELEVVTNEIVEGLDSYLDFVKEDWMKKNEIAIESTVRAEQVEGIVIGLKKLFEDFDIDLPEDKVEAIDAVKSKNENLETQLADALKQIKDLKDAMITTDKDELIDAVAEGLTTVEKDKFHTLAEGLEFDPEDAEHFVEKLKVVKENFFSETKGGKKAPKTTQTIDESVLVGAADDEDEGKEQTIDEDADPTVSALAKYLSSR